MLKKKLLQNIPRYLLAAPPEKAIMRMKFYREMLSRQLCGNHRAKLVAETKAKVLPLSPEHVRNCRLYSDRYEMLENLPKGGKILEVGSQFGNFAKRIFDTCQPEELHLIDWNLKRLRDDLVPPDRKQALHLHEGLSWDQLPLLKDGYFDWIYIDADHKLSSVERDARLALPKLKRDGYLVFNDYIAWSYLEGFMYGVVDVVNKTCVENDMVMTAFALAPDMYCDVALRFRDAVGST